MKKANEFKYGLGQYLLDCFKILGKTQEARDEAYRRWLINADLLSEENERSKIQRTIKKKTTKLSDKEVF